MGPFDNGLRTLADESVTKEMNHKIIRAVCPFTGN